MSDSGSDDGNGAENWVPYSTRPEWKDVKPIPQDDGPHPVVQIAYTDKCESVISVFLTFILGCVPHVLIIGWAVLTCGVVTIAAIVPCFYTLLRFGRY